MKTSLFHIHGKLISFIWK